MIRFGEVLGRGFRILCAAIIFFFGLHAQSSAKEGGTGEYRFLLEGKVISPLIYSLDETPETPKAGDVIRFNDHCLVLGKPGVYEFSYQGGKDERLFLSLDGGRRTIAAVKVRSSYEKGKSRLVNPLMNMKPAEIRELLGLSIERGFPALAEKLKYLDPAHTCVRIQADYFDGEYSFPLFPAGLKYLIYVAHSNSRVKGLANLRALNSLRLFILDSSLSEDLDISYIAANRDLRCLILGYDAVMNRSMPMMGGLLGNFKALRRLDVPFSADLADISFVSDMPFLKRLDITGTKTKSLAPLSGHPSLEYVKADGTPIAELPGKRVPHLRVLHVMETALTDEAVAAFAKENDACRIFFRYEPSLRRALAGVNHIQVISLGGPREGKEREKTLFEETDGAKVSRIVEMMKIDEERSGFHCMCFGDYLFRFMKNSELVATVSFHHGQSLRWDGWFRDGRLTPESSDFLCSWMAGHGEQGPLKELTAEKKRKRAAQKQRDAVIRLMPHEMLEDLKKAESKEEAVRILGAYPGEREEKVLFLFKMLGLMESPWNQVSSLDVAVCEALGGNDKTVISGAVRKGVGDDGALRGIARYLFHFPPTGSNGTEGWKVVEPPVLKEVLPVVAECGLAHPQAYNRRAVLEALGEMGGEGAIRALRKVLMGEIVLRTLPEDEEVAPGNNVVYRSKGGERIDEACSDRAYSAFLLAKLHDRESLDLIRRLAGAAGGADKGLFERALKMLGK